MTDALRALKPGESVFIPEDLKPYAAVASVCNYLRNAEGTAFTMRGGVVEDGKAGCIVWRMARE
ncbi:MAG: hypothetical protein QM699_06895 [Amaricoccus sp.]|uniref:hypothetical protein n=1 Tax=Amaricoccus sp. TaxID=1872485 RepID=UPI0039E4371E